MKRNTTYSSVNDLQRAPLPINDHLLVKEGVEVVKVLMVEAVRHKGCLVFAHYEKLVSRHCKRDWQVVMLGDGSGKVKKLKRKSWQS